MDHRHFHNLYRFGPSAGRPGHVKQAPLTNNLGVNLLHGASPCGGKRRAVTNKMDDEACATSAVKFLRRPKCEIHLRWRQKEGEEDESALRGGRKRRRASGDRLEKAQGKTLQSTGEWRHRADVIKQRTTKRKTQTTTKFAPWDLGNDL